MIQMYMSNGSVNMWMSPVNEIYDTRFYQEFHLNPEELYLLRAENYPFIHTVNTREKQVKGIITNSVMTKLLKSLTIWRTTFDKG